MTKIEWCDEVWNPVTGCSPVSVGCAHCYAKRMAQRLKGRFGYPEDEPFRVTYHADKLNQPLKWKKPRRIFVCSMGDLFHDDMRKGIVDWEQVYTVFHTTMRAKHHTFLILTKRPENMKVFFEDWIPEDVFDPKQWRGNLWLGISAENQQTADERIPILLQIPTAKRFVSLEPMLGAVDLRYIKTNIDVLWGSERIDWVIVGGLSLPSGKVQAPKRDWLDSIVEQCSDAGVPIFLKDNAKYPIERREFPQ